MDPLDHRPFLIGVAGGSSSGKTTIAERLAELTGVGHLSLIKLDSYYVERPRRDDRAAPAPPTTTIPTRSTGRC